MEEQTLLDAGLDWKDEWQKSSVHPTDIEIRLKDAINREIKRREETKAAREVNPTVVTFEEFQKDAEQAQKSPWCDECYMDLVGEIGPDDHLFQCPVCKAVSL